MCADQVGLLTGDHSIHAGAPVVVMTTEVLRNMLYAGSSTLADLGYVVMDEVHYLADRFRGAVWEEVIIHLPPEVSLVCLSATVSNAEELAEWLTGHSFADMVKLADVGAGDPAAHLRPTTDRVRESIFNLLINGRIAQAGDPVTGARVLTAGIPENTPQFAQVDLAVEALKSYEYTWAKLGIDTEGENLRLNLQFDGRPTGPLPFVYQKEFGGFVRVSADHPGSVFQGIRLDVNFRLPLDQLLQYRQLLELMNNGG